MTWERFGYICRKASVDCSGQESISACLSRVESEESCGLYGKQISNNSWPRRILDKIRNIKDRDDALFALEIYRGLNLAKHFEEPMRFKRVVAYLGYVSLVFYVVVGVYRIMVAPSFLEAFDNFDIAVPEHLQLYQDYWLFFVLFVSLFLVAALVIGFQLKKVFRFDLGIEKSLVMRFLVVPKIRNSYLKIIDILQFPVVTTGDPTVPADNPVIAHLDTVKNSKMSLSEEMRELIEIEMQSLLESCETQMKYMSVIIALIVIFAVFLFLVSAYSPIFILGETV